MAVTQKDIAEKLGISQPLVGMALRGQGRMSENVRREVLRVAQELGYSPHDNVSARSLIARRHGTRARTGTLAVVSIANFNEVPLNSVPFFAPLFAGIEAKSNEADLDICLLPLRMQNKRLPRLISERGVDGAICLGQSDMIPRIQEFELPIISLDEYSDVATSLVPDDREGTKLTTRHLIELGHRRIAYIGHEPAYAVAIERYTGYLEAMEESGLPVDEQIVEATLAHGETHHGTAAMNKILARASKKGKKPDFTAVVCYHDLFAIGAIRALQDTGLSVPEDVSIVGFDDVSTQYSFEPAITSIAFDRYAMGMRAVEIICTMIEGQNIEKHNEVFPVNLVVRNSTAAPRITQRVGKRG